MINKKGKQVEIDRLASWISTIIAHLREKAVLPFQIQHCDALEGIVRKIVEIQSLTYMRLMFNQINDMAGGMSALEQEKLNRKLRASFGQDLNSADKRKISKLEKILDRGHIKSDSEARLLEEWISTLMWEENRQDTIDSINSLLISYHEKKQNNLKRSKKR